MQEISCLLLLDTCLGSNSYAKFTINQLHDCKAKHYSHKKAQAQHEGTSMSAATADMLLLTPLERVTSPLAWLDEYRLTYSPSPPSSLALSLYRKTRGRTAQALAGVKVSKGVVWSWCSQGWRTAEINFQREPLLFWWAWNQRTLRSKARYLHDRCLGTWQEAVH